MLGIPIPHTYAMAFNQWQAFVEVCRVGSIAGAAQTLGYTQSAVSRQIATIEAEMQVSLLERLPRGVRPTAAGEALLHHARIVVNEIERGREAARIAPTAGRRLVIGTVPSAAAALVPDALRRLGEADPETPLQWSVVPSLTAELGSMVRHGEVDVAVVTDAPPGLPTDQRLVLTHLGDDEMVVVAPEGHLLGGRAGSNATVRLSDLAREQWIEDNAGSEAILRAMAARAGIELHVDRCASDLMSKTGLVAAGHGVALVPGLLVPALRPDLEVLTLDGSMRRGIFLMSAAGGEPPGVLLAALTAAAIALPGRPRTE
jgi:DNA-binding transcriptional LysR family regulator